jgi:hypothetical protein
MITIACPPAKFLDQSRPDDGPSRPYGETVTQTVSQRKSIV